MAWPWFRAAVSVLGDGAAELRHGEHDHVRHAIAKVPGEGRQRAAELTQTRGELTLLGALCHVGVPALHVRERHLQADVGLDELGDLLHGGAEGMTRIFCAVVDGDLRGAGATQDLDRVERLAARARE